MFIQILFAKHDANKLFDNFTPGRKYDIINIRTFGFRKYVIRR